MKLARDIMTKEVVTVPREMAIKDLARLFAEKNISGAPVVDDHGQVIGVVTENDLIDQNKRLHIPTVITILDGFFFLEKPERLERELKKIAGSTVGDIYSDRVVSVHPDTPLDEVATLMAEKRVHTLPVIEEDTLVGVIGKTDIIKTLI